MVERQKGLKFPRKETADPSDRRTPSQFSRYVFQKTFALMKTKRITSTFADAKSATILPSCSLIGYIVTSEITAQMPLDATFADMPNFLGRSRRPWTKIHPRNGGRIAIHDRVPVTRKSESSQVFVGGIKQHVSTYNPDTDLNSNG